MHVDMDMDGFVGEDSTDTMEPFLGFAEAVPVPALHDVGEPTLSSSKKRPLEDSQDSPSNLPRRKKTAACDRCRRLKGKCDGSPSKPCSRCTGRNEPCVFSPQKKRGRKQPKEHKTASPGETEIVSAYVRNLYVDLFYRYCNPVFDAVEPMILFRNPSNDRQSFLLHSAIAIVLRGSGNHEVANLAWHRAQSLAGQHHDDFSMESASAFACMAHYCMGDNHSRRNLYASIAHALVRSLPEESRQGVELLGSQSYETSLRIKEFAVGMMDADDPSFHRPSGPHSGAIGYRWQLMSACRKSIARLIAAFPKLKFYFLQETPEIFNPLEFHMDVTMANEIDGILQSAMKICDVYETQSPASVWFYRFSIFCLLGLVRCCMSDISAAHMEFKRAMTLLATRSMEEMRFLTGRFLPQLMGVATFFKIVGDEENLKQIKIYLMDLKDTGGAKRHAAVVQHLSNLSEDSESLDRPPSPPHPQSPSSVHSSQPTTALLFKRSDGQMVSIATDLQGGGSSYTGSVSDSRTTTTISPTPSLQYGRDLASTSVFPSARSTSHGSRNIPISPTRTDATTTSAGRDPASEDASDSMTETPSADDNNDAPKLEWAISVALASGPVPRINSGTMGWEEELDSSFPTKPSLNDMSIFDSCEVASDLNGTPTLAGLSGQGSNFHPFNLS